jgi:acetylglutamate synthase
LVDVEESSVLGFGHGCHDGDVAGLQTVLHLQKELVTDSGAGTLIRPGDVVKKATSLSEFLDLNVVNQALLESCPKSIDAEAVVDCFLDRLKEDPFTAYYDEIMSGFAIVLPPLVEQPFCAARR